MICIIFIATYFILNIYEIDFFPSFFAFYFLVAIYLFSNIFLIYINFIIIIFIYLSLLIFIILINLFITEKDFFNLFFIKLTNIKNN